MTSSVWDENKQILFSIVQEQISENNVSELHKNDILEFFSTYYFDVSQKAFLVSKYCRNEQGNTRNYISIHSQTKEK